MMHTISDLVLALALMLFGIVEYARAFAKAIPQASAPLVVIDNDLEAVAALMDAQNAIDGRSGEAKRHQVLAQLLKDGRSESDAAFAIERVIQAKQGKQWVRAE